VFDEEKKEIDDSIAIASINLGDAFHGLTLSRAHDRELRDALKSLFDKND
jgi:hypothetical protein